MKAARSATWLGLALLVWIVYAPALSYEFVDYDDRLLIVENPFVSSGITLAGLEQAWTTSFLGNWIPLTWSSLMLDAHLSGMQPRLFHFTNIVFHMLNVMLLFVLLRRLTDAHWRSALVAALFAVHPLHVESVAWVSERKDVLSMFFGLAALWYWTQYVKRSGNWRYALSIVAFVCSLMAKQMLVTLPFLLILIDLWPLQRKPLRHLAEKIPYFIISAVFCVVAYGAQSNTGSVTEALSLQARAANAVTSYASYLAMAVWPADLAVHYPHPGERIELDRLAVATILVVLVSLVAWRWRKERPWLAIGWCWYLGTLVPVIGLVQIGGQRLADRYAYFPMIGFYLVAVWLVFEFLPSKRFARFGAAGVAGVLILTLAWIAQHQLSFWKDTRALYERVITVTSDNAKMHFNLGTYLMAQDDPEQASEHLRRASEIVPDNADAHYNLAVSLRRMQRLDEALAQFRICTSLDPEMYRAHASIGTMLLAQRRFEEAIPHFRRTLQIRPDYGLAINHLAQAHYGRGTELYRQGQPGAARQQFTEALRISPGFEPARQALARIQQKSPAP